MDPTSESQIPQSDNSSERSGTSSDSGTPPPSRSSNFSPIKQDDDPTSPHTPAQAVLENNFRAGQSEPVPTNKAPSFQEVLLKSGEASSSAPLKPDEPILETEIQQITAEEFNRNMEKAQKATRGLRRLKLPRHLKREAESFKKLLLTTKRNQSTTKINS
ncbi:hypothetical protein PTTG_06989 [Puccinia triticina 1-1 BBBD Race 1]|uniref:Uncharacterized protein n=1 Tax=Puccinia triticina (isolate 1-1 / race 1 (BBBD)) TaxID=630390 RepID=A0A180GAJ2_PUCT1|nr:hypothetical protein PTTG_06989 [Puccinia triticina 1-1 BBBD Race 1]